MIQGEELRGCFKRASLLRETLQSSSFLKEGDPLSSLLSKEVATGENGRSNDIDWEYDVAITLSR